MIDVTLFESLLFLQRNWFTIASECNALPRSNAFPIDNGMTRERVAEYLIADIPQWVSGWDGYEKWWNWGISLNYQYPLGDAGVPKTVSLLKQIRGIRFANLSLLKANAILPMHTHPENIGLLTFHLGLDVPEECYIHSHGEMAMEENGKSIIFDGTFPHYSFNASQKDRLILYCEFSPDKLSLSN